LELSARWIQSLASVIGEDTRSVGRSVARHRIFDNGKGHAGQRQAGNSKAQAGAFIRLRERTSKYLKMLARALFHMDEYIYTYIIASATSSRRARARARARSIQAVAGTRELPAKLRSRKDLSPISRARTSDEEEAEGTEAIARRLPLFIRGLFIEP